ncbi:NAD(P)-dependent glycerol-3-phosphate dehydrogenase [Akkermansiaceae bacterium]|nr:NAD(P)-dependent glycerol-3-phosphate dehydrogenase [Akkermansiaceae bacterium]
MSLKLERPFVIGSGSWGTGLACLLAANAPTVTIVGRNESFVSEVNDSHTNGRYLPGAELPKNITATTNLADTKEADLILLVVPTSALRATSEKLAQIGIPESTVLLSCSKGIERESGKRMTEIIADSFPNNPIAAFSGPNHAEEIARELPAAATIGCPSPEVGPALRDLFSTPRFRAYTNDDVAGVELGGALKNIFAIAAGVASGLNLGDNAIAALATRSLAEMVRLGSALGGKPETFTGLSGVGDMITTFFSKHSRNHRVGLALAAGKSLDEAVEELGMVAEGVPNTLSIYEAARKVGIRTPIIDVVYGMLYEDIPPAVALNKLYEQAPRGEHD